MPCPRSPFAIAAALGCALCAQPAPAQEDVGPAWDAFVQIAAHFNDASFVVDTHVLKDDHMVGSVLRVSFRKPHYARCEVIDGNGAGGVAIWRGGNKVLVRPPGLLSRFELALNRSDSHVVDARGRSCGEITLDNFPANFAAGGTLSEATGPAIGGVSTDVVTWTRAGGAETRDTKRELFIAEGTHLPVESKIYVDRTLVEDSLYKDIRLDTGMPYSTFEL